MFTDDHFDSTVTDTSFDVVDLDPLSEPVPMGGPLDDPTADDLVG
jgi:hypothetical protein